MKSITFPSKQTVFPTTFSNDAVSTTTNPVITLYPPVDQVVTKNLKRRHSLQVLNRPDGLNVPGSPRKSAGHDLRIDSAVKPSDFVLGVPDSPALKPVIPNQLIDHAQDGTLLGNFVKLPPEILDYILQTALHAGVTPNEPAILSSVFLARVSKVIPLYLDGVIKQAEKSPSTPMPQAGWLKAQRLTTWLQYMLNVKLDAKIFEERKSTQKTVKTLRDRLQAIGPDALHASLQLWCDDEQDIVNRDAGPIINTFVEVYVHNRNSLYVNNLNAHTISDSIEFLQSLEYLDFSKARLTKWPKALEKLVKLKHLTIAGNEIKDITSNTILPQNLIYLDVSLNRFVDLPHQISSLAELLSLRANNNPITQFIVPRGHFKKLQHLYLDSTSVGTLPKTLALLPNLRLLSVSNNPTLQLPLEIEQAKNFELYR